MADRPRLTLNSRRNDGAYLVEVEGSPCALIVDLGEDGGIWANAKDAVLARGGWTDATGELPAEVIDLAVALMSKPGWCDVDE